MPSWIFSCCCSEDTRVSEDQLNFPAATDETIARSAISSTQAPRTLLEQSGDGGFASARSARSGTLLESDKERDKQKERDRLQKLVNRFARKAVKGVACTHVDEHSGERVATKYHIARGHEYVLIIKDERSRHAEIVCPIGGIQDIYSIVEDGEACFPAPVLAALRPEELEKLLMVVYQKADDSAVARFCLLEDSRASLDMFLECLKVLSVYAQKPSPPVRPA